jgi:alkylated DNA repair protein alkB family protein 8
LKHRKVRHYGYQFNYDTNNVDPDSPLDEGFPEQCTSVVNNLLSQNIVPWKPDQLTVNQYQPGQGK